jgi:hypothetical protein
VVPGYLHSLSVIVICQHRASRLDSHDGDWLSSNIEGQPSLLYKPALIAIRSPGFMRRTSSENWHRIRFLRFPQQGIAASKAGPKWLASRTRTYKSQVVSGLNRVSLCESVGLYIGHRTTSQAENYARARRVFQRQSQPSRRDGPPPPRQHTVGAEDRTRDSVEALAMAGRRSITKLSGIFTPMPLGLTLGRVIQDDSGD